LNEGSGARATLGERFSAQFDCCGSTTKRFGYGLVCATRMCWRWPLEGRSAHWTPRIWCLTVRFTVHGWRLVWVDNSRPKNPMSAIPLHSKAAPSKVRRL